MLGCFNRHRMRRWKAWRSSVQMRPRAGAPAVEQQHFRGLRPWHILAGGGRAAIQVQKRAGTFGGHFPGNAACGRHRALHRGHRK